MFALPGIILLLIFDYIKPQEVFPILLRLPLLHIFTALALLGMVIDLRLGLSRLRAAPQLAWALAFFAWSMVTILISQPDLVTNRLNFAIQFSLFIILGHAVQTFRSFQIVVTTLFVIGLFLAVLGDHQGMAPLGCHQIVYRSSTPLQYDGRECETKAFCEREGAEPGADYTCEHVGLLKTTSIGGRVRYRGTLADPNELALAVGVVLPFAFAFVDRKRTFGRLFLLVASCAAIGLCAVYTASRGGQLVFLAVLGVYFVRRAGLKGLILAGLLTVPLMLLGGRSGDESDQSTIDRLEAWNAGWEMFKTSPIFGVGFGKFLDYHWLTAHSSYVLVAAEEGLPGLWLFSVVLWMSLKTGIEIVRRAATMSPIASTWGTSQLAAMIGFVVGIGLLSFAYKEQLWIYIGLSGALYQCVKRHDPTFTVVLTRREGAIILALNVLFILGTWRYVLFKGI